MTKLGKIDMRRFEKRRTIDPAQELVEYNQEIERIDHYFADKDDPHVTLIIDIALLNNHPDVIEEIKQAFRHRYLHSPYVLIYMLSSDRNQCGNPTLLDETGLAAFNKVLPYDKIIFETTDCKNLEPGIDPNIRTNQLISLAKYHQNDSFLTYIVTEDQSLSSLSCNLGVRSRNYASLHRELDSYKEYCKKGNSSTVEGSLDWGLLRPWYYYSRPLSYFEYKKSHPSLIDFVEYKSSLYFYEEDEEETKAQGVTEITVEDISLEEEQAELASTGTLESCNMTGKIKKEEFCSLQISENKDEYYPYSFISDHHCPRPEDAYDKYVSMYDAITGKGEGFLLINDSADNFNWLLFRLTGRKRPEDVPSEIKIKKDIQYAYFLGRLMQLPKNKDGKIAPTGTNDRTFAFFSWNDKSERPDKSTERSLATDASKIQKDIGKILKEVTTEDFWK